MALLLKTNNTKTEIAPRYGRVFSLGEMQDYVGGHIDTVRLTGDRWLIVNDEGLIQELPLNLLASAAAERYIAGDAVLCRTAEIE